MYLVFKRMPSKTYSGLCCCTRVTYFERQLTLLYKTVCWFFWFNTAWADSSLSVSPSNSSNRIIKGRNHSGFSQRSKARGEQHMQTMTGTRKPGLRNESQMLSLVIHGTLSAVHFFFFFLFFPFVFFTHHFFPLHITRRAVQPLKVQHPLQAVLA